MRKDDQKNKFHSCRPISPSNFCEWFAAFGLGRKHLPSQKQTSDGHLALTVEHPRDPGIARLRFAPPSSPCGSGGEPLASVKPLWSSWLQEPREASATKPHVEAPSKSYAELCLVHTPTISQREIIWLSFPVSSPQFGKSSEVSCRRFYWDVLLLRASCSQVWMTSSLTQSYPLEYVGPFRDSKAVAGNPAQLPCLKLTIELGLCMTLPRLKPFRRPSKRKLAWEIPQFSVLWLLYFRLVPRNTVIVHQKQWHITAGASVSPADRVMPCGAVFAGPTVFGRNRTWTESLKTQQKHVISYL